MNAKTATRERCQRYSDLIDECSLDANCPVETAPSRYALVTVSRYGDDEWLTTHDTIEGALAYAADDGTGSYDWEPTDLVDLDTGRDAALRVTRSVTAIWSDDAEGVGG